MNRAAARRGADAAAVAVLTHPGVPAPDTEPGTGQDGAVGERPPGRPAQPSLLLPRVVPLRVAPVPGEALDSWLHAYARRLAVPVTNLLTALGLCESRRPALDLTIGLSARQARRAAHAAGLPEALLHEMTLASYAPAVVHLRGDGRALATTTPWLRRRGSRYCPDCLRENGGRWLLRWQLSWSFACTRHHALLRDLCPACGMIPRCGSPSTGLPPPACGCAATIRPPGARHPGGVHLQRCAADLSELPTLRLDREDPRLATQHDLDSYLQTCVRTCLRAEGQTGQTVSAPAAQATTSQIWTDIHALAWWFALTAAAEDFAAFDHATTAAWQAATVRRWARHQHPATSDARLTAALLTWALPVAATAHPADPIEASDLPPNPSPGPAPTPALVEDLTRRRRRAHRATSRADGHVQGLKPAGMRPADWQELSDPIKGLLLRAADPDLPKTDRLRGRTPTPAARLPDLHGKTCAQRTRWIPQTLWPEWLIRLMPQPGYRNDVHRAALAAALNLPGLPTPIATSDAVARTHPHLLRTAVPGMLRRYLDDGHTGVLAAICDIAEGLDSHGSPIHYHRRRRLITPAGLLTQNRWEDFCEQAGAHPGIGRRLIDARRYLFTTLTGADLADPGHRLAYTANNDRMTYFTFVEQMPAPLRALLLAHAAAHLDKLGLDEPLTWSPPTDWIASAPLDALPGRDPDDIDLDTLAHLAAQHVPASAAAQQLGTSIDHIRLALERLARPSMGADPRWFLRRRADRLLTRRFFQREYLIAGKPLRQIGKETGFPRKLLSEYARAAGIELRRARPPTEIDPSWLREQYLTNGRTFTDIGAELGVTDMTAINAARRHGIPARPQGVTSRADLLVRLPPNAPPDLRRAVDGQLHAWCRLDRFAQAMTYPSLSQAAAGMGVSIRTLVDQFHRLEHDIGAPLYHRATRSHPQRPTPRGETLLQALAQPEIKTLRHPRARPAARGSAGARSLTRSALIRSMQRPRLPDNTPRDLRRAVQGRRGGWTRLDRFAAAMTYPTLTEASAAIGINHQALIKQLHRLETDIGAPLYHRATISEPQQPTRRGAALLRNLAKPATATLRTSPTGPAPSPATSKPDPPTGAPNKHADPPRDLRRAVQGQRGGWTRLERFATAMTYPTLAEAAAAIGINRTTLIGQLHRLENDLGEPLYHRATPEGRTQQPTRRGQALLQSLAQPDIQPLRVTRARLPRPRSSPSNAPQPAARRRN